MDYLILDVALAQLLAYFVSEKGYTIVSVQQDRDDLWLIQPKNRSFPILRLCRESREELQSKQSYLRQVNRVICDLIHRESKVIVVNVDQRAESFEDEEIRQVALLRNDDLAFARAFPDARGQLHEVSDARAELARLSRRMEETRRRPHVWRTLAALFPRKTLALFVLVIALSLAFQHVGVSAGFSREAILDVHALWRQFSAVGPGAAACAVHGVAQRGEPAPARLCGFAAQRRVCRRDLSAARRVRVGGSHADRADRRFSGRSAL